MRNVVFCAPFPLETSLRFARAAARLSDVRLLGVFQEMPRGRDLGGFADVQSVGDGLSVPQLIEALLALQRRTGPIHRLIGVFEPLQVPLAQARAALDIPGTRPEVAERFRDKARMKDHLREADVPVARHHLLATAEDAGTFAQQVPFPWVLKPPAGMGARSTFRVHDLDTVGRALQGMGATRDHPVLAEEFLRGDEGSFDALVVGGRVVATSISHYLPGPLTVLENPWVQWCCVLPRSLEAPGYHGVDEVGTRALHVLGLQEGLTHMEWFRREDGSVAVGEVAQRPPGANITRMIGLAHDIDPYRAWARAEIDGAFDGPWTRSWSVGCAYLRGPGQGRVAAVTGVAAAQDAVGALVEETRLPKLGAPKSASYEGDGYVIVKARETGPVQDALTMLIRTIRVHYA